MDKIGILFVLIFLLFIWVSEILLLSVACLQFWNLIRVCVQKHSLEVIFFFFLIEKCTSYVDFSKIFFIKNIFKTCHGGGGSGVNQQLFPKPFCLKCNPIIKIVVWVPGSKSAGTLHFCNILYFIFTVLIFVWPTCDLTNFSVTHCVIFY